MPRTPALRRTGAALVAALFAACAPTSTPEEANGEPQRALLSPGTATVRLEVQVVSRRTATAVRVAAVPADRTATLRWDAALGAWTGSLALAAPVQILTATAFAGNAHLGAVTASAVLGGSSAASAWFRILDTAGGWPLAASPALTALVASPVDPLVGDPVYLSAQARDRLGRAVATVWSTPCAGSFVAPGAPTTLWAPSAGGTCLVTARVMSSLGRDARSVTIAVGWTTGTASLEVAFAPWPVVREVGLDAAGGRCLLSRTGADASCHLAVRTGETASLRAFLDARPESVAAVADDCGGSFAPLAVAPLPDELAWSWTAPALPAPTVCTIEPSVDLWGMRDAFPVAVAVEP